MRELESSLQQFGEFLLKAKLARERAAPYFVRWVRRFLTRPASEQPLVDQTRHFCDELQRNGGCEDWQVRQAEEALRVYFVNFLHRTDWHHRPQNALIDELGQSNPLAALEQLRLRLRTRHYSYRTECAYVDWARRFFDYAAGSQGVPHPRIEGDAVRDFLTHLAVRQRVSASTQNQAFCAMLFLCREVLGVEVGELSPIVTAKRGVHLPVVLSMPETAALLGAMRGTARLMAAIIYGGGLRVSECCQLRVKDIDVDQGLVFVRAGKGDKDRSTLLAETGREELSHQLRLAEAQYRADRESDLAGVWMPDALDRKYPKAGMELGWFWVFPSQTLGDSQTRGGGALIQPEGHDLEPVHVHQAFVGELQTGYDFERQEAHGHEWVVKRRSERTSGTDRRANLIANHLDRLSAHQATERQGHFGQHAIPNGHDHAAVQRRHPPRRGHHRLVVRSNDDEIVMIVRHR